MMQQHDGIQEASDDSLAKRPVKFIKNPLPGPKPHVKKEMNYDYEVPPDKIFLRSALAEGPTAMCCRALL